MDPKIWLAVITGVVAFAAGIATDFLKHWSADWLARRQLRRTIQAEFAPIVISLNFFILEAIEDPGNSQQLAVAHFGPHFGDPPPFAALDYYWNEKREALLRLPEWARLQGWRTRLLGIHHWQEPALFSAIMLFEALLTPPLDQAVSKDSLTTIRSTLGRGDVEAYKMAYFRHRSGIAI